MITNHTPAIRAPYAAALKGQPHIHEGKLGKLNAAGEIELATSADDAFGIICDPDSLATAVAGNATSATLVHRKFAGIIQVNVGSTGAAITPGTKLVYSSGGVLTTGTGTAVAVAVESAPAGQAGQMVNAILL